MTAPQILGKPAKIESMETNPTDTEFEMHVRFLVDAPDADTAETRIAAVINGLPQGPSGPRLGKSFTHEVDGAPVTILAGLALPADAPARWAHERRTRKALKLYSTYEALQDKPAEMVALLERELEQWRELADQKALADHDRDLDPPTDGFTLVQNLVEDGFFDSATALDGEEGR